MIKILTLMLATSLLLQSGANPELVPVENDNVVQEVQEDNNYNDEAVEAIADEVVIEETDINDSAVEEPVNEEKPLIQADDASVGRAFDESNRALNDAILVEYPSIGSDTDGFITIAEAKNYVGPLVLASKEISGTLKGLEHFVNATRIDLHYNKLTGTIPAEFENLTQITSLDLNSNQLTGSIPKELGNLELLKRLDLRNNQLSGQIPSELGNLLSLEGLRLSNNLLEGTIPAVLFDITTLKELRLNDNQLSGELPSTIGNANSLSQLIVHNNHLTGAIRPEIKNLSRLGRGGSYLGDEGYNQCVAFDNNHFTSIPNNDVYDYLQVVSARCHPIPGDLVIGGERVRLQVHLENQTIDFTLETAGIQNEDYTFATYPAYEQFTNYGFPFTYTLTQPDGTQLEIIPVIEDGTLTISKMLLTQLGEYTLVATTEAQDVRDEMKGKPYGMVYTTHFEITVLEHYEVIFDSQDGSEVKRQSIEYNKPVAKPEAPTKVGYTFGGWYTDTTWTYAWDFEKDTVTGNLTLYAKWEPIDPVTYSIEADDIEITVTELLALDEESFLQLTNATIKRNADAVGFFAMTDTLKVLDHNIEAQPGQYSAIIAAQANEAVQKEVQVTVIEDAIPNEPETPEIPSELPQTGMSTSFLNLFLILIGGLLLILDKKREQLK